MNNATEQGGAAPSAADVQWHLDRVVDLLSSHRFLYTCERDLQDEIENLLRGAGLLYAREFDLDASRRSRVDFYLPGPRIGIEIKIKGSPSAVGEQMHRYGGCDAVSALVLVTARVRTAAYVGASVCGKPVRVVSLWRSL